MPLAHLCVHAWAAAAAGTLHARQAGPPLCGEVASAYCLVGYLPGGAVAAAVVAAVAAVPQTSEQYGPMTVWAAANEAAGGFGRGCCPSVSGNRLLRQQSVWAAAAVGDVFCCPIARLLGAGQQVGWKQKPMGASCSQPAAAAAAAAVGVASQISALQRFGAGDR
eukprot:scaffold177359_cov18-Tisochrysis_lutea.AAC.2